MSTRGHISAKRSFKPQPLPGKGDHMTATTVKKVETLVKITRKNISRVRKIRGELTPSGSPFVGSAAKYYPALKRLASK